MDSLNDIPCPLVGTDRNGLITDINASLLDLVGRDAAFWLGRSMDEMLPLPSRIFLQTHAWPMLRAEGQLAEIKLEVVDVTGTRTPVLVNCKQLETLGVESFKWVLFVSRERSRFELEILEAKKRAEADAKMLLQRERALEKLSSELLAAQDKVRLANESGGIGIWDWNLATGALVWDAQSYRLYGLEPRTEIDSYELWARHLHPDDKQSAEADFQRSLATGEDFFSEFRVIWPDGSTHYLRGFGRWRKDASGKLLSIVGTNIDVTQAALHAQSLQLARDAAEAASQSKGQFLANMSHEIRTPMNAILGMLNLVQNTELTAQQRDYAVKAEGAAKSLLGLLNDILDYSKVDAGKMELECVPLRLEHLLRDLSVVLASNAGTKNIEILFDIDPQLPAVVVGDVLRLKQVLINLCGNAVKFTSQGHVILAVVVQKQVGTQVSLLFSVQDSGIGIAPEHQDHIFSGFSQAEASTTRRFGGTGLGLAICKRLVELMGGNIQLVSTPGVGSTFSFVITVPLGEDAPDAPVPIVRNALVVDDDPIAGSTLLRMVTSLGWSADLATSGAQALELVESKWGEQPGSRPYDVVYMDWHMPVMDGWQATKRLQEWSARRGAPMPRTVMVSARGRESLAQRSPQEQDMLYGFLVKPVTAHMLREAAADEANGSSRVRALAKGRTTNRQLSGMRILVVDDNLINQQVAQELLSNEGAVVTLAGDGQLGVDAVRVATPPFDVVLMDIQMPVLDGYGATRCIREELGLTSLPIVAMTANAMASDREDCLARGMNEHVGKPFDMAKLVSLLIRTTGYTGPVSEAGDTVAHQSTGTSSASSKGVNLEIPGLDVAGAITRMSGLQSLYVRTARDFAKTLPATVSALGRLVQAGDAPQTQMQLHTLKGNAGTLGATALSREAARLELLCTAKTPAFELQSLPLETLDALAQSTLVALGAAVQMLSVEQPVKAATGPLQSAEVIEALEELSSLLGASDMAALQRFAELEETLNNLAPPALAAIVEAMTNLEFETALAHCEDALKSLQRQQ